MERRTDREDKCTHAGRLARTLIGRDVVRVVGVVASAAWLAAASAAHGQCLPSFAGAVNYGPGTNASSVAIGDLNRDGTPDLAVAANSGVLVLLGNGDATLQAAVAYAPGTSCLSVAIGDLNRDGKLDLVTATGSHVSVLLGTGNPNPDMFAAAVNCPAGSYPRFAALGDLNGDGRLDVAMADAVAGVFVVLGNGDGTFQPTVSYGAGLSPECVAIDDLNADGKPDLAVANYGSDDVSVLLGNGSGGFGAASNYAAGSWPYFVAIGDLNGDGRPDLALPIYGDVAVLLNSGNGTFEAARTYRVNSSARSLAIGDLNGDGRPDLAAAHFDFSAPAISRVIVLLGDGSGMFSYNSSPGAGTQPRSVAIGDLNGDGKPDLATANHSGTGTASVLVNNGSQAAISQQPAARTVRQGQEVSFSVTASGATYYRWRRNGVPLTNAGRFSGVTTSALTVTGATTADAGVYDVQIISVGGCNSGLLSKAVALNVTSRPADFDDDGDVDLTDFQTFQACFNGPNRPSACL